MQKQTPEEAWSGVKPTVDYFRVFGCLAHVHILDQQRVKLDDKSRQCVFLELSDESKAYRFFDPINKKVLISKDVIFEEQKGWNWEQNTKYQQEILHWEEDEEDLSDIQASQEENVVDVSTSRDASPDNYETLVEGKVRRNRREPV